MRSILTIKNFLKPTILEARPTGTGGQAKEVPACR